MSKSNELLTKVHMIVRDHMDPADYEKICEEYRDLTRSQKVMKRPPKGFQNGDWLKEEVKRFALKEYLQRNERPEFYMLYEDCAERQIASVMEELAKHIGYFHRDWWLDWSDRVKLHQRFRELNPEMARLNDLLEFIVKTPPVMRKEPFYKVYLREFWKGIGEDLMKLLKLPKMQDILLEKSGVTFWTEGTKLCSNAWTDRAGSVVSIFKQDQIKDTARQNAGSRPKEQRIRSTGKRLPESQS